MQIPRPTQNLLVSTSRDVWRCTGAIAGLVMTELLLLSHWLITNIFSLGITLVDVHVHGLTELVPLAHSNDRAIRYSL